MATDFDSTESFPKSKPRTILCEGYLHKKGQINRSWKKRYFILYSDKKLAYFTNQELTNHAAINEINLSTVEEVTLLRFGKKTKKKNRSSMSISNTFTDLFANRTPTDSCSVYTLNMADLEDEDEKEDSQEDNDDDDVYQHHDLYVDAPINTQYVCSRRHAFALSTEKRDYWLSCANSQELNEWIIHLKYAIFGKLILNGYLTKKTKKKLKTKWKQRYIEIYESKILRIYKNEKKAKVKEQIDLDATSISKIKCVDSDIHSHPFPIEIYDADGVLAHVFSAKSKEICDEFMQALNVTMGGNKIDVLFEGSLYYRGEDVKCWKKAYFALTNDSLLSFKNEASCKEFKDSIYSMEQFYNEAFDAFVVQNIAMDEPEIEKKDYSEIDKADDNSTWLELLKIFMIKTNVAIWYFATEEALEYLSWCQSLLSLKTNDTQRNNPFLDSATKSNTVIKRQRSNDITEIKHVQNALASTEALFMMHINTDLSALNESFDHENAYERKEEEEGDSPKIDKRISMKAMMAVNLDKKPTQVHTVRSKSVQFTPFSEKELQLMIDTENDIDDSYKDSLENNEDRKSQSNGDDDYVYITDSDQSSESDRDCLESTTNVSYYKQRKETETHYIVDDDGY